MTDIQRSYAQKWVNFILEPKTIVSVLIAVIAIASWIYAIIARFDGIDLNKLASLSKQIETISEDNITLKANHSIALKIVSSTGTWIYSMQSDGNFTVYQGCLANSNLRYGTDSPSARYGGATIC